MTVSQSLAEARASGFTQPPARKVDCPIIDAHVHARRMPETDLLRRAADLYGVRAMVAICSLQDGLWLRQLDSRFQIAVTLRYELRDDPQAFARENLAILREAVDHGVRVVKFWFKPKFNAETGLLLHDPRLDPIFSLMAAHRMVALVHIADPDVWFEKYYADRARFGTKADQYVQLETTAARYRDVTFQVAHMGGDPEHLDHLERLLARHPNLVLDTSATKWIVRELGRQPEQARSFVSRHADRIVFGTDHVVTQGSDLERYTVRYWIHQMFWETSLRCPLPIEDPDAPGPPRLIGLDLPADVLRKIYWETPGRMLGMAAEAG